ncbi:MAG: hypothetical protein EA402_08390 [Planctomycetota bacterium]|nr:MAG: hypothetical protein EA402_08390 [Planctomycetota bacterium]
MSKPQVIIHSGAPRLAVDALRYLSVRTSGATGRKLARALANRGLGVRLIANPSLELDAMIALGIEVVPYESREDLDRAVRESLALAPAATLIATAAINDYAVQQVSGAASGETIRNFDSGKIPSGLSRLLIELRPAPKQIDCLAEWGHVGPLVACKYEAAGSVIASAKALCQRVQARLVLANSLCATVQALVDLRGQVETFASREDVLSALVERVIGWQ